MEKHIKDDKELDEKAIQERKGVEWAWRHVDQVYQIVSSKKEEQSRQ